MPEIPINPNELPTETEPLDETVSYRGRIVQVGDGMDKNSHAYINLQVEIISPEDYEGRKIRDPYVPLPWGVEPDMDAKARRRAMESGVRLGRLCRSANFNPRGNRWHTEQLIGEEIEFTVKNEEYPQGSGRLMPKINDYIFDKPDDAPPF